MDGQQTSTVQAGIPFHSRSQASAPPVVLFVPLPAAPVGFPLPLCALVEFVTFHAPFRSIPRRLVRMDIGASIDPRAPPRRIVHDHHVVGPTEPARAPTPGPVCGSNRY